MIDLRAQVRALYVDELAECFSDVVVALELGRPLPIDPEEFRAVWQELVARGVLQVH